MTDLNNLEQKIFMSYFQDGIVDILIGIMFIFDGVLMMTDNAKFIGLAVIFTLMIGPLKQYLIIPRAGFVKFRVTREQKIKKSLFVSLVAGIVIFNIVLFFLLVGKTSSFLQNYAFLVLGLFIAMLPLFGAYVTGVKRFYLYAGLIFLVFVHENFTHSTAPMDFTIFGIILFLFGLYYLSDFMKKHPLPEYGVSDDQKE